LGQLQFAKEPAGKLRTFAMLDVVTQTVMTPLHDIISNILKTLPNDGTFDQNRSYERARQKSIKYSCSFGFDLSAATDRLPIQLQSAILVGVFNLLGFTREHAKELSIL